MQRLEPWFWAAGLWLTDFVTKRLVLAHAELLRFERVEVLGDFFRLVYVRNPGAAMGLTPFGRWTLVAISTGAVILLCWFRARGDQRHRLRRLAMGLILGGALGNLVDRVFYDGLVVDFLDFGLGVHRFWAFNVADIGVSCGGLLLMISVLSEEVRARRSGSAAALAEDPPADQTPDRAHD